MEAGRSADDFVGTFARGGRIDVVMGALAGGGRSAARSDAFMGAIAEGFSPGVAAWVGALAALGRSLITVPTFLPLLGGMITENSSTCSLESFLGGSKGTLAELRRLSPGSGKYECRPAFLTLLLETLLAF